MSHFLLPSTPIYGHVMPMLTIGRGLVERGHQASVLTGRKFRGDVEAHGLRFLPLPTEVDYDDAHLENWLPGREHYRGIAAGRYDIIGLFVRPMAAQHRAFTAALARDAYDGVVAEAAFMGTLPTLLSVPATRRIPIVGVSATPLSLTSVDCAPFGSGLIPADTLHNRFRARLLNAVLHGGPLKPIQTAIDGALTQLGAPKASGNYFDCVTEFDLTFQLAAPGIEYPRREMPDSIRFVGPLQPPAAQHLGLPSWWGDLDGSRPVVHLTQGTMDNVDLGKLLAPAIRGLADEDVLVVASTGGRPVGELLDQLAAPLPANARVAEFLPYAQLLPLTDVMVTNGGFGGVQRALAHGLPLVVAGVTEDKPEVGARVAWSGSGINLRTGNPTPRRVRQAVRRVLSDPRYRARAERLQREIGALGDPIHTIVDTLDHLCGDDVRLSA